MLLKLIPLCHFRFSLICLISLFGVLWGTLGYGQASDKELTDTKSLCQACFETGNYDLKEALLVCEKARTAAMDTRDSGVIALSLNNSGIIEQKIGNLDQAETYYIQSYTLREQQENAGGMSASLNNLGLLNMVRGRFQEAVQFYARAYTVSLADQDTSGMASAMNNLGNLKKRQGAYEEAVYYYKQALALKIAVKNKPGSARTLGNLGGVYLDQGDFSTSIAYYEQSVKVSLEYGATQDAARNTMNIGVVYFKSGQLQQALDAFIEALEWQREMGDEYNAAMSLHNIGAVYTEREEYKKAEKYCGEALELFRQLESKPWEASTLSHLGAVHQSLYQMEQAEEDFLQALKMERELENEYGIAANLFALGDLYSVIGNSEEGIEYLQEALALQKGQELDQEIILTSLSLGAAHLRINHIDSSIFYLEEAYQLAEATGYLVQQRDASRDLADAYGRSKNYTRAQTYFAEFLRIQDSLNMTEVSERIAVMEAQFETRIQAQKVDVLTTQNELTNLKSSSRLRQRNLLIGISLLTILLTLALFLMYRTKQRANAKLKELDEIKSRFFANISHEFRTPLTLILGPLQKRISQNPGDEPHLEDDHRMYRSAKYLLNLNNQLQDFAKLEAGSLKLNWEYGDLQPALKEIVMAFSALADQKNIKFKVSFPAEELLGHFDRINLEKILNNLLSNAFKFTSDSGEVGVEVSHRGTDSKQIRSLVKKLAPISELGYVEICVADSGIGMSKGDQAKIFDRFYQINDSLNSGHGGTGIGLALTRELIELQGGWIGVESEPGNGSRFTVVLPLGEAGDSLEATSSQSAYSIQPTEELELNPEGPALAPTPISEQVNSTTEKPVLLIAEDNPDLRAFIREQFVNQYEVLEAENGAVGLEKARTSIPDIVISDLMMPEMDGIELCQNLKSDVRTSHIPVVLLTALATVESRVAGLETGADDYIHKPFNIQELTVRVANLVEQRRKLRERFSREVKMEASEIAVSSLDEVFLKKVIQEIETRISDPKLSVEVLGQEVGMSRVQLYRKLKALTDQTPSAFIRSIRLRRAATLLEQNFGNVADAMYEVGFSNSSYFAKCFREMYGVPPSEYGASTKEG